MDFQDVVRRRHMVRTYTADPVDPDVVDRMLRNALHAPSAGFSQGWAFLVLDRPADVDRFWAAATPSGATPGRWLRGMRTAPVVIVPLSCKAAYLGRYAEPDKGWTDQEEARWSVPYWHIDTGMAALLILQTAVDEGLGACFFGIPPGNDGAVRAEFDVPGHFTPIGAITLGHPAPAEPVRGSAASRPRKGVEEVVHRGGWSQPS
ncbi:nitroreductase family protein [Pengzhenrongella frigida]|uniref:Nitroreductase family protein n=1 Tax=Pengzhenrongella frigida TaxID=1259133 RepID=A0A4Q5MZ12_9MICO|nr:nitroreductase family protein [Cellulomonas sp. HLT2-17]RYV50940.1 nitroreductase family protein [Cellulomonas sp. HLT2-17]